jgi:hypothetical protein
VTSRKALGLIQEIVLTSAESQPDQSEEGYLEPYWIFFLGRSGSWFVIQETTEDNDQAFLEKMEQYTRSANGVPVERVSIPAKDLRRLIEMVRLFDILSG